MENQSNEKISPSLGWVKHIIAVASGKGGVGKSTTTVNLAYGLSRLGFKVGILDADVYGPSLPQMVKVDSYPSQESQMITPALAGEIKIMSPGFFVEAGQASILRGPMASQIINQFLTQVSWGNLDYLLIDYPPGTGDIQLTISQATPLTGAILVTTPQEVSLIDVRKAGFMFQKLKVRILGAVETMSYFVCDECDKRHKVFPGQGILALEKEFGCPVLAQIPMETAVSRDCDLGTPSVLGTAPAGKAYLECAEKIWEITKPLGKKEPQELTWRS